MQGVKMTETQDYQEKSFELKTTTNSNHLLGKVVLLVGNDTAVLQTLITQLARKGADIALVCRKLPRETVRRVRQSVESLGQRFLFIEESTSHPIPPNHLIQTVVTNLGNLDIFIDLSAQKKTVKKNGNGASQRKPNWHYAQAVLKELAKS